MERERLEVARRVMKAMRHASGRRPLDIENIHGGRQVVICLGSDTVQYATERVVGVGGAATVVVPKGDHLVPLTWTLQLGAEAVSENDSVHQDSTLDMLVKYVEACGGDFTFHVTTAIGGVDISEAESLTVPA